MINVSEVKRFSTPVLVSYFRFKFQHLKYKISAIFVFGCLHLIKHYISAPMFCFWVFSVTLSTQTSNKVLNFSTPVLFWGVYGYSEHSYNCGLDVGEGIHR